MIQASFTITEGKPPKRVSGAAGGATLTVDFNPAQLKLTVTNTMQDEQPDGKKSAKKKDSNPPPRQNVRKSATKLDTELVFDSTDTGSDVRIKSNQLKMMGRPKSPKNPALPQVTLEWGLFSFTGVIESITETLDFWSGEGVPLRSTMQIVMQSLDLDVRNSPPPQQANATAKDGRGTTGVATEAGDARAGRALAAANGLESMRMPDGGELSITDDVEIIPPAAFSVGAVAGGGVSAGIDGGFGPAASVGFAGGASAGFAAGASAGFGVLGQFRGERIGELRCPHGRVRRPQFRRIGVSRRYRHRRSLRRSRSLEERCGRLAARSGAAAAGTRHAGDRQRRQLRRDGPRRHDRRGRLIGWRARRRACPIHVRSRS